MKKKILFFAFILSAFVFVGKANDLPHTTTISKIPPTKIPCGVVLSKIVWTYISIIA